MDHYDQHPSTQGQQEVTDHRKNENEYLNQHDVGAPSGFSKGETDSMQPQAFTSRHMPGRYDVHPQHEAWDQPYVPPISAHDEDNGRLRPVRELPSCFHALYDDFR